MKEQDLYDNRPANHDEKVKTGGNNYGWATSKRVEDNLPDKTCDGLHNRNNGTLYNNKPISPDRLSSIS